MYTDNLLFTFAPSGTGCKVGACSESQGASMLDYSTNYCNLHDLYCADASCRTIGSSTLSYVEQYTECTQNAKSDCYSSGEQVAVELSAKIEQGGAESDESDE